MQILLRRFGETCRARCETSLTRAARGSHTTMSNSGANAVSQRSSACNFSNNASAADWHWVSMAPNWPPLTRGSRFCVAHKATAAAPGREHSRLISPRCISSEVKYV